MVRGRNFTVGVEEEYLLVDLKSRDLICKSPTVMLGRCGELFGDRVTTEFLKFQVKISVNVCATI